MTIDKYIRTLARQIPRQIRNSEDMAERNALRVKLDYARAYKNGTLDSFRDRMIEREIGKTYTVGAQIAILYNRDTEPDEYATYQEFRAICKVTVDAMMVNLANEIHTALGIA